ncbi:MAG: DUF945 family protein [Mariprofundaceae bacterium]|nr:DUF945 family protein [Mariprofundaceae bacterium]
MKKGILVLFVLLVGAGLAAPKFMGDVAKEFYHQAFVIYPSKDKKVQFEHKSYTQSWFSAQAVSMMHIRITEPKIGMDTLTAEFSANIQHGPILLTDTGLALGAAYIQTDINWLGLPEKAQAFVDENVVMRVSSLIDFNHSSSDAVNIKGFTYEDEKVSATFGGLTASGTSKLDYSVFKGDIQLPASQIVTKDIAVNIADASSTFDMEKYQDVTFLGTMDATFPLLEIVAKQSSVRLEDISITSQQHEEQGKLNSKVGFAIKKITAPIPLNALAYDVEINQLDFKTLELWMDVSQKLQTQASTDETQAQLRTLIDLLLQDGLQIKQWLKVEGMGGTLSIDWDSHLVALPDGQHIMDALDSVTILQAIMMDLRLEVDAAIIMSTPFSAMVTPYITQGLIAEENGKLIAAVKLDKGVLTVNEQVLPLAAFLPMLGLKPAVVSPNKDQAETLATPAQ